jgi:hypothetical protein
MSKKDAFSINKNKAQPHDFAALAKEIKANLMDIVEDYGFTEAKQLQDAIDAGKISIQEVKEKVGVIIRQKFSELFNKEDHKELMAAIKNKEVNFPEFYSYLSNFLLTINPPKKGESKIKTKFNIKPLSEG